MTNFLTAVKNFLFFQPEREDEDFTDRQSGYTTEPFRPDVSSFHWNRSSR
jgi:hypothetical protein